VLTKNLRPAGGRGILEGGLPPFGAAKERSDTLSAEIVRARNPSPMPVLLVTFLAGTRKVTSGACFFCLILYIDL